MMLRDSPNDPATDTESVGTHRGTPELPGACGGVLAAATGKRIEITAINRVHFRTGGASSAGRTATA